MKGRPLSRVEEARPKIREIAEHMASVWRRKVDPEELEQIGVLRLAEIDERFDPTRGTHFEAYWHDHVVGVMLNEVLDRVYNRDAQVAAVFRANQLDGPRRENPAAMKAAMEAGKAFGTRSELKRYEQQRIAGLACAELFTRTTTGGEEDMVRRMHFAKAAELIRAAISRLDERAQAVVFALNRDGKTLAETAELVDRSVRQVQRIHEDARIAIAEALAAAGITEMPEAPDD